MRPVDDERRFRALVEASSDVVYSVSPDWREIRYLYGRNFLSDQIEPSTVWLDKYIHPDDQPAVTAAIAEAVAARRVFQMEHRVLRIDGSPGWITSRAVPIFDSDGKLIEWIGAASDVTPRRQIEQALAEARAQSERQRRLYEAILANTPDLAYVWNFDHRFVYANEGLLRMYGKSREEVIGRRLIELGYEPWHAEMHEHEMDEVIATGKTVRGEVPFKGSFGLRIYDYILVPVVGPDGRVEAVGGITRDVTDYRANERRKDEFLATLSHELRNPLASLRNGLHLMRTRQANGEEPLYEMIGRQVERLARLVDDLSDISRYTCGLIDLRRECIDLVAILRDAVESSNAAIAAAGHRVDLCVSEEPLWVDGDALRLMQILVNLIDNAVRYTENGGVISLAAAKDAGMALITVRDNGIGISAAGLTRIFELFSRERRETSMNQSGLGIGLTLSRRLAELHDGSLEASSEGEGCGSEFRLRLPLASSPSVKPATTSSVRTPRLSGRILIVDDNRDAADSMAMVLGQLGAEVTVAYGGREGLESYARCRPRLVLLDIGMPGLDGYEVARRLRERDPDGAILVALTGWGEDEDRRRARDVGFAHHLVKPVDLQRLRALLEDLVPDAAGQG